MIPALSVRVLNKSFGTFALKDITFEVPQGTVCAIIGENGSGKSSTLECILGIDIPDSGNISIYGINPQENIDAHSLVGVAFDSCPFQKTVLLRIYRPFSKAFLRIGIQLFIQP